MAATRPRWKCGIINARQHTVVIQIPSCSFLSAASPYGTELTVFTVPINLLNDKPSETAPRQPDNRHAWRDRAPFLLYALTGFTGLLAEQGFEKYIDRKSTRLNSSHLGISYAV